jgi:hypothetical protein
MRDMSETKKHKEEGLVRVDFDLDFKTYAILLALVEKSGYVLAKTDLQKSEGIRGVLTQGILELYQKYVKDDDKHSGLDIINQQAYIYANRARAMSKNDIPDDIISLTLLKKLPDCLTKYKEGELSSKGALKEYVAASNFPNPKLPPMSQDMWEDTDIAKRLQYFKKPSPKS